MSTKQRPHIQERTRNMILEAINQALNDIEALLDKGETSRVLTAEETGELQILLDRFTSLHISLGPY